jgi:hypothetical protein
MRVEKRFGENCFSVQRLNPIYANLTITEGDLPEVQREMARGTLKADVRLPSDAEGGGAGAALSGSWRRLATIALHEREDYKVV